MQPVFRERVRSIEPYRDIVDQVERNCHGKGGVRRSRQQANLEAKLGRKPKEVTPLEDVARALATSRTRRYAKAMLSSPDDWPKPEVMYPEVAFVGRSNVGKSSLLNKISQFGTIAAVSSMPGMTKHVSWFRNRKVGLDVIDMPGYGYADRAKVFGPAALEFVKQRTSLKCVYILIDARHGFKKTDHEWLTELGSEGPMKQVVLTKCDMVAPKRLIKIASLARSDLEGFRRVEHKILLCSSVTEAGIHDLRLDICRRCNLLQKKHLRGNVPTDLDLDGEFGGPRELPGRVGQPLPAPRMPPPVETHRQRGVAIDEILDFSHLELDTLRDKSERGRTKRKGSRGMRR